MTLNIETEKFLSTIEEIENAVSRLRQLGLEQFTRSPATPKLGIDLENIHWKVKGGADAGPNDA